VPSNAQLSVPAATTSIDPQSIPGFLLLGTLAPKLPMQSPALASTPSLTAHMPTPTPVPTRAPTPLLTPAPLPVLQPTTAVTTSPPLLPTLTPVASLSSAGMQCASLYGQCGGNNWMGAKCCSGQATCQAIDEYYSQCVATIASDSTMIMRKDVQVADLTSLVRPAMLRWSLTLLPVAGGVLLVTLILVVLAVRRRPQSRQSNRASPEDGSPMLPLSVDAVP